MKSTKPSVPATPLELAATATELWMMMAEAQAVIAMRMMGLAGVWSVLPSENMRMVSEKGPAFAAAAQASNAALAAGLRPDEVLAAWVKPLRKHTRANAARLSRRGFARS